MELAGDKFVGIKQHAADVNAVDILRQPCIRSVGVAGVARHVPAVDQTGCFGVGGVVTSGRRVAPMDAACSAGSGVRFPGTCGGGVATVSGVLAREKLWTCNGCRGFHGVGGNGDGNDLFSVVVFISVIAGIVGNGSDDEATREVVGGSVQNGVSSGGRPLEVVVVGLTARQRRRGVVKGRHDKANRVNDVNGNG